MNKTNFQHAAYGLLIQLPFGLLGRPWVGALVADSWFVSREHAQRENQLARETDRKVEDLSPIEGFRGWDTDRKLDALFPVVATALAALLY